MGWIAGIRGIKVQRDGNTVALQPGEPCPEAEDFKNRNLYLDNKQLDWARGEDGRPVPPVEKTEAEKALELVPPPAADAETATETTAVPKAVETPESGGGVTATETEPEKQKKTRGKKK